MIFIAYSWADAKFVHEFAKYLKIGGSDIWIDYENLNIKTDITTQIKEAIKKSNVLICFESIDSIKSNWVKFEKATAKRQNKPIISLPISSSIYLSNTIFKKIEECNIIRRP